MSSWKKFRLDELCSDIIDCVNKTAPISATPTPYKMLRTSDIRNGTINLENLNCVTEEIFNKWTRRGKLQYGDIVFTREAPLGEVGLVKNPENLFLGQRLVLFRVNPQVCDNRFLVYALMLHENKQAIIGNGVGSTVLHLRVPECAKIQVSAPELSTQHRIADILSAYDDLIENNQQQIKLLEEAAQRLYKEWFVDLHFPGWENTTIVDGVPEGWKRDAVDCIVKLQSGYAFKSKDFDEQGTYKIVTIKNVQDGVFEGNNTNKIVNVPSNMPSHCYLHDGDILLSLTGNIGRLCQVSGNHYLLNQRVAKLKSDYSGFAYCLFRSNEMFHNMNALANGAAQQNLSPVRAEKIQVLIPNAEILMKFEKICTEIFSQMSTLTKQSNALMEARDRLLPKLMSGELEV